jgi:hypothetical protein
MFSKKKKKMGGRRRHHELCACVCVHDSKSKSHTLLDAEDNYDIWHLMRQVDKLIKIKSNNF